MDTVGAFLKTVQATAQLSDNEQRTLVQAIEAQVFESGAVVVEQGAPLAGLYIVKEGEVE